MQVMTDDLISRQAAIKEIEGFYPPKVANESEAEAINRAGWECAINCIEAYLRTVKPIDPVKHGKWIVIPQRCENQTNALCVERSNTSIPGGKSSATARTADRGCRNERLHNHLGLHR